VNVVNWGQTIADAVALGAIYGVVALGIGLVFGVLRLVNFAYGEVITFGGYTLYLVGTKYQAPAAAAIAACIAACIAMSLLQELLAFRPLRRRGATTATMLVATFAISFLLQAIYLLGFGSRGDIVGVLGQLNTAVTIGSTDIRWISIVEVAAGVALLLVTAALLGKTSIGLHIRAAAADFRTARILGVRANGVIGASFVVSGILAAAVAILYTVSNPLVTPDFGVQITIFALIGVVVGGLERLWTATLGGFVVGFVYGFFGDALSSAHSIYLPSVVYGLVILVLLLRPVGLFAPFRPQQVERV